MALPQDDLSPEEVAHRLEEYTRLRKLEEQKAQEAFAAPIKTRKVYKSVIPSCNYIFPSGKAAVFIRGYYTTDMANEIEHLDREIANKHPHITSVSNDELAVMDRPLVTEDMMAALRAQIITEYEAERAKSLNRPESKYEAVPVKPASSHDVAVAMAGGSGAPVLTGKLAEIVAAQKGQTSGVKIGDLVPQVSTVPQETKSGPDLTALLANLKAKTE